MFMVNGAETEEIIEIISLLKGIGDHLVFTNEKISRLRITFVLFEFECRISWNYLRSIINR